MTRDFLPYRKLQQVLNRVRTLSPDRQEPALQRCLDENPILIYRALFVRHWSQPRLADPDPLRRDIIPDFILEPRFGRDEAETWEVLEIKTSAQAIANRGRFTTFFLEALEQLALRYSDYFASARTAPIQLQELEHVLLKPRLALLIGRRPDLETRELLSGAQEQSDWNAVQIISYDDLVDVGIQNHALQRAITEGIRDHLL